MLEHDVSASSCRHYQMQIMKFEFRIYSSISAKKKTNNEKCQLIKQFRTDGVCLGV